VEAEPLGSLPHIPYLRHVVEQLNPHVPDRIQTDYNHYGWSETKRAPNSNMKTVPESIDNLFEDFKSTLVWDLLDDASFERIILNSMGNLTPMLLKIEEEDGEYGDCVGRISVVQEPGFKARFLANPRRVFQVALKPFGRQVLGLLATLPWDCTHNQAKGPLWAQAQLKAGKTVYSVDLSDATNNFPLDLQIRVLRWLNKLDTEDIRLFECLAKGWWFVPRSCLSGSRGSFEIVPPQIARNSNHEKPTMIKWTKGQPLGLYPSFPSFALTHGCLLRAIELRLGVDDTFRVLGDDVVISNDDVHKQYREYLRIFRMPISESKTISSDLLAEFAGLIISKQTVFSGVKWRQPNSNNKLHLLSTLTRTLDLTDRNEFLSYVLKTAPAPYGSGGNPEGLPLRARAALFSPWLKQIQGSEDFTQLERPTVNKLWYQSKQSERPPEKCSWRRDDLEAHLATIESEWDKQHPYSQIKDRYAYIREINRKIDSMGPLKFWARLSEQFNFIDCECPVALLKGYWFKSGTGLKYMTQCIDDQVQERLRSSDVIGKWLTKLLYQEQIRWFELSEHRKEQLLQDAIQVILES